MSNLRYVLASVLVGLSLAIPAVAAIEIVGSRTLLGAIAIAVLYPIGLGLFLTPK